MSHAACLVTYPANKFSAMDHNRLVAALLPAGLLLGVGGGRAR
jgi:hypothetical protein